MLRISYILCTMMAALSTLVISGNGDDVLSECGQLSIETPTVLGRNITFSFIPDTHDPNAKLSWQRKSIGETVWSTLSLNYTFTQYQTNMTYQLVLTDSVRDDEQIYRVHYHNDTINCSMETEKLALKVPPSTVMLEVKFDLERPNHMYAVCTVNDFNSDCKIQFSATGNIIGSERHSINYTLPHGAWNAEYAVDLNVSKEDNGTDIACVADCKGFSGNLTDTASILIPYPPVVKFNISDSVLNITEGKQAHVECLAESSPASNISWIEESNNGNVTTKQCTMASNCVFSFDADIVSKRRFVCLAHYLTSTDCKNLTVNILEKTENKEENGEKQENMEQASNKLFLMWIIIGSCLLVTCIIIPVVLFVVIRKRRQYQKEKKESRVRYRANADIVRKC